MTASVRLLIPGFLLAVLSSACASGPAQVETPRTVVIYSGERILADRDAMTEVDRWLRIQREEIDQSRDFVIRPQSTTNAGYPWRDFEITGDTALVFIQQTAGDAETPFLIYAHLRLMAERDELAEWLPEEDLGKEGLELELAILDRVADVWLLGRSVYDTQAFGPLDEILYAREAEFLRELVLETQTERFAEERQEYFARNPERREAFREWLERVFERSEPGYVEPAEPPGSDLPPDGR